MAAGYDAIAERYAEWQSRTLGDPRGRLIAVDVSEAQLTRARAAVPEAEFVRADITAATFAPARSTRSSRSMS